jgi:Holliday junction DNA helicase RuvA
VISQVRGVLTQRALDRVEVLTSAGVAYDVHIPFSVLEKLPRVGEPVALHTAQVTRDDGSTLYGFVAQDERELFRLLLTASGVGPSLALNLLSALSPQRLAASITARDVATLQRVPRVGKKTAERLCVELGDKLKGWAGRVSAVPTDGVATADAVRALVSLGYAQVDAERAVRGLTDTDATASATDLIRRALAAMQGR